MYLYLIQDDDISFMFHNICLIGGYLPYIGECNELSKGTHVNTADDHEPAMWFKVTVLDHITVDCSRKVLKWSMHSLEQDLFTESLTNTSLRVTRSLYLENECDSIESSLDTLFEVGVQLAKSILSEAADTHDLLMSFLTELVLPEVKISREDEDVMKAALEQQIKFISNLDTEIDMLNVKINRLKDKLKDIRIPVVDDFHGTEGRLRKSRPDLYDAVHRHLQRDIDGAQKKVQNLEGRWLSQDVSSETSAEATKELEEARARLTEVQTAFDKLTSTNRTSGSLAKRNILSSPSFLRDRKPIHDSYLATSRMLDSQREQSSELLKHKVAAVSIKEAMRSVLKDLSCVEETVGYEIQAGAGIRRMPTDIYQKTTKPCTAFTSISERVHAAILDPTHPACAAHEAFCRNIKKNCCGALGIADATKMLGDCNIHGADVEGGFLSTQDGKDGYEHVTKPSLKDTCELLSKRVAEHCISISNSIDISGSDKANVTQKKRLCYEYYLFENIGKELLSLFHAAQGDEIRHFANDLGSITAGDLDITEPWQVHVLAEARGRQAQSAVAAGQAPLRQNAEFDYLGSAFDRQSLGQSPGSMHSVISACNAIQYRNSPMNGDLNANAAEPPRMVFCRPAERDSAVTQCSSNPDGFAEPAECKATKAMASPTVVFRTRSQRRRERARPGTITACQASIELLSAIWRREIFSPVVECWEKMGQQPSPLGKMQLLTRCLRIVADSEGKLHREVGGSLELRPLSTCSDDLIAAVTLVVLCAETSLVYDVCVQLKFIECFMNGSLQSGVHDFSVTTFEGTMWHLRDLVLMKRRTKHGNDHLPRPS